MTNDGKRHDTKREGLWWRHKVPPYHSRDLNNHRTTRPTPLSRVDPAATPRSTSRVGHHNATGAAWKRPRANRPSHYVCVPLRGYYKATSRIPPVHSKPWDTGLKAESNKKGRVSPQFREGGVLCPFILATRPVEKWRRYRTFTYLIPTRRSGRQIRNKTFRGGSWSVSPQLLMVCPQTTGLWWFLKVDVIFRPFVRSIHRYPFHFPTIHHPAVECGIGGFKTWFDFRCRQCSTPKFTWRRKKS